MIRSGARDFDNRVLRGGSWDGFQDNARSANRYWGYPSFRFYYVGFEPQARRRGYTTQPLATSRRFVNGSRNLVSGPV